MFAAKNGQTVRLIFMLIFLLIWALTNRLKGQGFAHGRSLRISFNAPSIQGNPAGENARRHLTVYLPPGYDNSNKQYPVLYFLHGYTWNDSTTFASLRMGGLMDTAIQQGIIRPVILVLPDSYTHYKGSFYTNSALTGNWADFIGKDVVHFVDENFRTLALRECRAVAGISMGGNGALKIGMLYADVFSSVYASSPATLNWSDGTNLSLPVFRAISDAAKATDIENNFPAMLMVDIARTYSPNLKKPPFFADMPAYYKKGQLMIDTVTRNKWTEQFATEMVDRHLGDLRSLRAIKIDWGRNDEFAHIPVTALALSKKLERYGVKHFAEEFLGGHDDKLGGREGRFYSEMLPFFNRYLSFSVRESN